MYECMYLFGVYVSFCVCVLLCVRLMCVFACRVCVCVCACVRVFAVCMKVCACVFAVCAFICVYVVYFAMRVYADEYLCMCVFLSLY